MQYVCIAYVLLQMEMPIVYYVHTLLIEEIYILYRLSMNKCKETLWYSNQMVWKFDHKIVVSIELYILNRLNDINKIQYIQRLKEASKLIVALHPQISVKYVRR